MNIKDLIRNNDGQLPAFAWPGGYSLIYFDRDNETLCAKCATQSFDDPEQLPAFKPKGYDIYYEGPTLQCSQCNIDLESTYGDPDEKEQRT